MHGCPFLLCNFFQKGVAKNKFDAVNDNLPEIIEMYGTNSRKITCDC